ncbi:MAG: hypothetical protein HYR73_02370, partial [Candidatus Eisenbacteria bacterium]|nr:hypothetical protein [Candidatus Eisenbacteria bacterium]
FVMLVLLLCQQLAVLGIEVALGAAFIGRLQPWTVVVANLLAATCMAFYQWRRHPNVVRGIDRLWLQDHD